MRILGVIPARLGSTRLPQKPLQPLAGEPLVTRVARRVAEFGVVDELVVATDAAEVCRVVERAGLEAVLTKPGHQSGTARVAEVAGRPEYQGYGRILNVQGDEPFIDRAAIEGALEQLDRGADIGTAAAPLAGDDAADRARVKVVFDQNGRALYFSRARIPHVEGSGARDATPYWLHLGIYAYTRAALLRWVALAPTPLEGAERLEQLRPLGHGMSIGVAQLAEPAQPGVDTAEDLKRAEALWITLEVNR